MSALTISTPGNSNDQAAKLLKYILDNNESDQNGAASVANGLNSVEDTLMDLYSRPNKEGSVTVNGKTFKDLASATGFYQEKYRKAERIYTLFQEFRKNAHDTLMNAIRNLRNN